MNGSHATRETRRVRRAGVALVAVSLIVNRFTLGLLSADGAISGPIFNAAILFFQFTCVAAGLVFLLRPRYRSLTNAALTLATSTFCLIIMEIGLRLFVFGPIGLSPSGMRSMEWLANRDLIQASQVESIVYELRPSLRARHAGVVLETNARGMHDDSVPDTKPTGEFRIAVLGDSFSMASGIALEETWHQQLEKRLSGTVASGTVRCLNFAVAGYQLPQYLGTLEYKAAPLDPDLVIVGFCAENDHQATPLPAMRTLLDPVPRLFFLKRMLLVDLLSRMNYSGHHRMDKTPTPEETAFVDKHFAALAAFAKQHQTPVVILFLANIPRPSGPVRAMAEAHGLPFVDAASSFTIEGLRANSTYHPIDSHPNARANEVFADAAFNFLREESLLPDGG